MNVLIACERSGVVREAFNAYSGVHAVSYDLAPAEDGRTDFHIQGDAIDALRRREWDLVIAHPTCTFLCNSGSLRLYRGGKKANGLDVLRWYKMQEAAEFFRKFFTQYGGFLCVENPIMHGHARKIIGLDLVDRQNVQPYYFGDDASKATVLWLRGLPRLTYDPRKIHPGRRVSWKGHMVTRWSNQTDSGQNRLPPSPTRAMDRARTYPGLAAAMAAQWIPFLLNRKSAQTN